MEQSRTWSPDLTIGSTTIVTTALSAGYVMWAMRGSCLVASFIATLPAWRSIDPLPILQEKHRRAAGPIDDDEADYNSLQSLVRDAYTDPAMWR
jgi:hypothetical protein